MNENKHLKDHKFPAGTKTSRVLCKGTSSISRLVSLAWSYDFYTAWVEVPIRAPIPTTCRVRFTLLRTKLPELQCLPCQFKTNQCHWAINCEENKLYTRSNSHISSCYSLPLLFIKPKPTRVVWPISQVLLGLIGQISLGNKTTICNIENI